MPFFEPSSTTPRTMRPGWSTPTGWRSRATPAAPQRLRERERQLLREHELRWTAPLHGLARRARFRRGFPECVTITAEAFLARAGEVFRLAPVRHLILTEVAG